jgi:phage gp29-like protein
VSSEVTASGKGLLGLEIATTQDGMDITRGYTGPLLMPSDNVLRKRGNGDLSIYEQVLSDPQVAATFEQRRRAVTSAEWHVEPASNRRADKKAADFIRSQLQRVGLDKATDKMLYGVFYGYAVAELLYDVTDEGLIGWSAIKVRNRRRFRFTPEGELRMLTLDNMLEGIKLPEEKFWHFCTGADHDDEPYGLGLGHWLYWPALFKRNGIKFWLTFIEKFAAPTAIGKYDAEATATERKRLLQSLRAIQTDSGIIIPKGMEVSLLEAARAGTVDYRTLHDTMDATIAKVVLGQTASTQGTPGKLGNEELQSDVRDDIIKADADLVCESLNLGPIAWLTRMNFADADPPRVYRALEEPEDLNSTAERDNKIYTLGFKPTLAYIQSTYGGEWIERQTPAALEGPVAGAPPAAEFAAGGEADPPTQMVNQLDRSAGRSVNRWIDQIRLLVDNASSWDEVRDGLGALIPEMTLDDYADAMAEATAAARLAGRYEVTSARDADD